MDEKVRGVTLNSKLNPKFFKSYIMISNVEWEPEKRPSKNNQPHLKLDLGTYSFGKKRTMVEAKAAAVAHRKNAERILYPDGLRHSQAYKSKWANLWEMLPDDREKLTDNEIAKLKIPDLVLPSKDDIAEAKSARP